MDLSADKPKRPLWEIGQLLCVLVVMAVNLCMQWPTVRYVESTGEDEVLFMHMSFLFRRALDGDSEALKRLCSFYYPPLQWLLPYPFLMRAGPMEWALRLPGAVASSFGAGIWWLMACKEGMSGVALFSVAVLLSATGIIANHAYGLTLGLFSGGAACMAWGLYAWLTRRSFALRLSWWWVVVFGWLFAVLSLPDAFFFLPGLLWLWARKALKPVEWQTLGGWMLEIILNTLYVWLFWMLPRSWGLDEPGMLLKLRSLVSKIGTLRLAELFHSFAAASSWPAVICSLVLIPLAFLRLSCEARGIVWVFIIPLILWTFVFGYSNVRSAHLLLAYPVYALLFGKGADVLFEHLKRRNKRWYIAAVAVVLGLLTVSVVQAVWIHLTPFPVRGVIAKTVLETSVFPQGRRYRIWGQSAAGWWIQRHDRVHAAVMSNLGGAFGTLYARRPSRHVSELALYAADPRKAKEDNVRYYAHALDLSTAPSALDGVPVAVVVAHRGSEILRLYDLWRIAENEELLDANEGRKMYEQRVLMMWQRHRAGI